MAEVPVSPEDLEGLVSGVSLSLFEKWGIEDRVPDNKEEEYAHFAVADTAFVINMFMEGFNELTAQKTRESLIIDK